MAIKPGDVVLTRVQYTDTNEVKTRPAVVLFEEFGNIVVAGITSNRGMKGIPLSKSEGALVDSVIKLNYVFTVSERMIERTIFSLKPKKRGEVFLELTKRLKQLEA